MSLQEIAPAIGWIILALDIVLRFVALGVIPGNRRPSTGMAWLLLILIEPIIGFVIFWLFGRTRLESGRIRRQKEALAAVQSPAGELQLAYDESGLRPAHRTITRA